MGFGKIDFGAVKLRKNTGKSEPASKPAEKESTPAPMKAASFGTMQPSKPAKKTYGFAGVQQFAPQPVVQQQQPKRTLRRTVSARGATGSDADKINQLLTWVQGKTAGYKNVHVTNFTTSFKDGLAFCAIIDRSRPGMIDFDSLDPKNAEYNLKLAFDTAERLGVPRLLDESDIVNLSVPERLSIITYVLEMRKFLH